MAEGIYGKEVVLIYQGCPTSYETGHKVDVKNWRCYSKAGEAIEITAEFKKWLEDEK